MAGMLPGVEAARRRRVHQTSTPPPPPPAFVSSRRPSFSLFSTSTPSSPSSSIQERRRAHQQLQADEKLGQVAREAKGRLDERLRAQRKTPFATPPIASNEWELKREVYGSKKSARKLMGWSNKLGWKAAGEQEDCAVCLDEFKVGDTFFNLPCAHRFHVNCLLPWLHSNAHCPCCRIFIFS